MLVIDSELICFFQAGLTRNDVFFELLALGVLEDLYTRLRLDQFAIDCWIDSI